LEVFPKQPCYHFKGVQTVGISHEAHKKMVNFIRKVTKNTPSKQEVYDSLFELEEAAAKTAMKTNE
jgi:hypothetical protein